MTWYEQFEEERRRIAQMQHGETLQQKLVRLRSLNAPAVYVAREGSSVLDKITTASALVMGQHFRMADDLDGVAYCLAGGPSAVFIKRAED